LAGGLGYGWEEIVERIRRSPAQDRIEQPGFVPDAELIQLYRTASIFAFPSLDEGFGIPLLEAMAHGAPIVASNRSAVAEVAAGAAILVDPEDSESIAEGMLQLAHQPDSAEPLTTRGLQIAADHSWLRAAEQTYRVYVELLGN